MARIRTIKPEFFTSDDVCGLDPLARLLFIGLWGIADREGRMKWRPKDFKLQVLPGDACDIDGLCTALVDRGLVVLYGDGLAYIPTFLEHQTVNPRETASKLPKPDESQSGIDASNLDLHAQRGREGKGKEGKEIDAEAAAGAALTELAQEDRAFDAWNEFAKSQALLTVDFLTTTRRFRLRPILTIGGGLPGWDIALAKLETALFLKDPDGKFHRWVDFDWLIDQDHFAKLLEGKYDLPRDAPRVAPPRMKSFAQQAQEAAATIAEEPWPQRVSGFRRNGFWQPNNWGPPPGQPGCRVPAPMLAEETRQ